jgi:hypothetical protein
MDPTTLPAAVLRLGAGKSAAAGATVFEMLRIGLITTGSSIRTTPPLHGTVALTPGLAIDLEHTRFPD